MLIFFKFIPKANEMQGLLWGLLPWVPSISSPCRRSCSSLLCYIDTYLSAPSASVRLSVSGFLGVLADYSVTIRYLLGRSKGCGTLDCFEAVLSNASGTSEV